ncbi:hypothetical protein Tco_0159966 [Tanacetum coccineum]
MVLVGLLLVIPGLERGVLGFRFWGGECLVTVFGWGGSWGKRWVVTGGGDWDWGEGWCLGECVVGVRGGWDGGCGSRTLWWMYGGRMVVAMGVWWWRRI